MAVALLVSLLTLSSSATGSARQCLQGGLAGSAAVIDLADASLSPAELREIYTSVLQENPSLFFVAPRLSYTVGTDGRVGLVYPAYNLAGEELAAAKDFYDQTVAALAEAVESTLAGHPHTEAEVALLVHDLLAARYDYDVSGEKRADAYRFFRDGIGVCQAYALAAMAVLSVLELEADFVAAPAMDHAWVHVRVDGAWYHMDVTRDDPVLAFPDGSLLPAGKVTHTHLLRSDEGMRALGYHDFSCSAGHTCTDTRYESADAMAAFSTSASPLLPFSVGADAPLVWVADGGGVPLPLSFTPDGLSPHAAGDVDGDGCVTPADLLYLHGEDVPEAWLVWVREAVVRQPLPAP